MKENLRNFWPAVLVMDLVILIFSLAFKTWRNLFAFHFWSGGMAGVLIGGGVSGI